MARTRQEVREGDAREIARRAFNAAADVINGQSLDKGIALAAAAMVSRWMQAEVDTQALLGVSKLEAISTNNEA